MVEFNSIEFNLIGFYLIEKNAFRLAVGLVRIGAESPGGRDRLRLPGVGADDLPEISPGFLVGFGRS